MNEEKLLFKEISYKIQGIAYNIRNEFGPGLKEKIYQNAFAESLKIEKICYEKEKEIAIFSSQTGNKLGIYKPDFLIEDKIILEIKAQEINNYLMIEQLMGYLKNSKYELGYLINFSSQPILIKRIIYTNNRKKINKLV